MTVPPVDPGYAVVSTPTVRRRNRRSARDAGARAETAVARYLAAQLHDDRIERRTRNGAKDRGDVAGVRAPGGGRVVVEVKDVARLALSTWVREAIVEAGNDDAVAGLVVHKRAGTADPGQWYVTTTLDELLALLTGEQPNR